MLWRSVSAAAAATTTVALWCLTATLADYQPITIGSLHEEPATALMLSVAVEAALRREAKEAAAEGGAAPGEGDGKGEGGGEGKKEGETEEGAAVALEPGEQLSLLQALCVLAGGGAAGAVAGGAGAQLATAAAARVGLPLLLVEPAPHSSTFTAVNLYPHPDLIAEASRALVLEKGWRHAVLLHEGALTPSALPLLALNDAPHTPVALAARRLPPQRDHALLRNLLLVLKKSGATNFIVWCSVSCIERVLVAAQRAGLLAARHSYLLLDMELHTTPLEGFSYGGSNVTALRLFDPMSEAAAELGAAWAEAYSRRVPWQGAETGAEAPTPDPLPAALLLAYEGARLLSGAWRELRLPAVAAGDCRSGRAVLHAETLVNHMRTMEVEGSGGWGPLRLDADGARRDARLEVVELMRGGDLQRVAWWRHGRLEWRRTNTEDAVTNIDDTAMTNKTFNVLIALSDPYVMLQDSKERLSGNSRYEGFCIELIDRLAQALHFNYTFVIQQDGRYGELVDKEANRWDGMMDKLINDPDIHFAITDLTITAERERAVDFTTPFMNLGISILFKQPKMPEPELFAFLSPFSNGVWLGLALAYVGTSLVLYAVGRLCPEEWQNPYPCVEEAAALENQFTLANALWFNLGAVLLQGSEIAPIAYGSRAVASVWWLFALVITSSYTANLATLLAKKTTDEIIHNAQELADNTDGITYGAKQGGSTYTFFQHSDNPLYKKMFEHMPHDQMPTKNDVGTNKVLDENYAYLMESTTIEYLTQRNCKLKQVGSLLDNKGYGLAMKKNGTYRQALNLALLNLQERGVLREMKHQWWNEKRGGGSCNTDDNETANVELSMKNFLGLFLVLVVGSVLGVLYSFIDLVYHSVRRARLRQVSVMAQLRAELRFVFRFGDVKPLLLPLTPTPPPPSRSPSRARSETSAGGADTPAPLRTTGSVRRRSSHHTIHNASVRLARLSRRDTSRSRRTSRRSS